MKKFFSVFSVVKSFIFEFEKPKFLGGVFSQSCRYPKIETPDFTRSPTRTFGVVFGGK